MVFLKQDIIEIALSKNIYDHTDLAQIIISEREMKYFAMFWPYILSKDFIALSQQNIINWFDCKKIHYIQSFNRKLSYFVKNVDYREIPKETEDRYITSGSHSYEVSIFCLKTLFTFNNDPKCNMLNSVIYRGELIADVVRELTYIRKYQRLETEYESIKLSYDELSKEYSSIKKIYYDMLTQKRENKEIQTDNDDCDPDRITVLPNSDSSFSDTESSTESNSGSSKKSNKKRICFPFGWIAKLCKK